MFAQLIADYPQNGKDNGEFTRNAQFGPFVNMKKEKKGNIHESVMQQNHQASDLKGMLVRFSRCTIKHISKEPHGKE